MRTKSHTFTQSQLGLVMLANRRGAASTELFLRVTAHDLPVQFYTPLHISHGPRIGFLHFTLGSTEEVGGVTTGTYELSRLLEADCPCPGPVVALSGVLWNRRAVLAAQGGPAHAE